MARVNVAVIKNAVQATFAQHDDLRPLLMHVLCGVSESARV
jgi:hypothetical protein